MSVKEGWAGRFYEDFEVGDIIKHPLGRTITETDAIWLSGISMNLNQLYFNLDYGRELGFEKLIVNPAFTLALVTGMSVGDISRNGINLEWQEISNCEPLFIGETVYAESEVLEVRESKSRPEQGIVTVKTKGITESGKVVLELKRSILIYREKYAPQITLFPETGEWD